MTEDIAERGLRYTKDDLTIKNFYALEGGMTNRPVALGPPPLLVHCHQKITPDDQHG
jgi:hypothetical protein